MIRSPLRSLALTLALASTLALAHPAMADESIACNQSAQYDTNATGATRLIVGAAKQKIYICGYGITAGGTTNASFKTGTGTNCGTNTQPLTPAFNLVANGKADDSSAFWRGLTATEGLDVCFNSSGTTIAAQVIVYFTQR